MKQPCDHVINKNWYLPKKVAGDVTNSIVEQLNFEVISISLIFLKFVVFEISFHLRGCDEKEVLSNDITCEEAVDLQQDWDSLIWHISLGTTHIIDNKDERSYWVKAENFQFSLIASIQLAAAS